METAFVDTNILVYAASDAKVGKRKTLIAHEITLLPKLHISVQVLNEFIVVSRNAHKLNLQPKEENKWLQAWFQLEIEPLTRGGFQTALEVHFSHQLSPWDSLIVSSALEAGCDKLFSEDMHHGQIIHGLKIINPFLEQNEADASTAKSHPPLCSPALPVLPESMRPHP